ncbi:unnamed protein product, partial [Iphiclides podalirius]
MQLVSQKTSLHFLRCVPSCNHAALDDPTCHVCFSPRCGPGKPIPLPPSKDSYGTHCSWPLVLLTPIDAYPFPGTRIVATSALYEIKGVTRRPADIGLYGPVSPLVRRQLARGSLGGPVSECARYNL